MPAPAPLLTAVDVEHLSIPGKQVELVRGRLVVREPPGTWHGTVAGELFGQMRDFVRRHSLGIVCAQDTGYKIASNPDTVRGAAVAFVARERMHLIPRRGYAELAPDLVAEVVSPDDRAGEVLAKVGEWLGAGTRLVWVIDPRAAEPTPARGRAAQAATVYRHDGTLSLLAADGALDGEDVLPGFASALRDILNPFGAPVSD
jgi:Uma2 family endonuclease